MIAKGGTKIVAAYKGGTEIKKVYLGSELLLDNSGSALPYDAEIEYLESTGTQYINTGIKPNNTYTFETKVAVLQTPYNCMYWGCRSAGDSSTNNSQCYLNSNTNNQNAQTVRLYSTTTIASANWNSNTVPIVGTMYHFTGITVVSTINQMTYPITLFGLNNIGSVLVQFGICRIGQFTAYSNGVKVIDMIPVKKNGVGYMYDKVSGQLFGNAGSGSFVLGNEV